MRWLRSIAREVLGLFVDDGSFAIGIVVWVAIASGLMRWIAPVGRWGGPVLFVGLALVLVESVVRFSWRRRR
jgi:hypothetical protein